MKFKDKLRELRSKAGLTQQQLSEKAGIPLPSLRGHEQGQRQPSWASVVKLARALGVSSDVFAECDEVASEPETTEPPPPQPRGRPPKQPSGQDAPPPAAAEKPKRKARGKAKGK